MVVTRLTYEHTVTVHTCCPVSVTVLKSVRVRVHVELNDFATRLARVRYSLALEWNGELECHVTLQEMLVKLRYRRNCL